MSQLAHLLTKLKQSGADRVFFVPNEPGYTLDGSVKRPMPGGALRPALLLEAISELLSGDDLAGLSSHRARIVRHEHEGEEFVYVIHGQVEITVGKKKSRLKREGTLHFDSGVKHSLKNPGREECVLLVAVYTP